MNMLFAEPDKNFAHAAELIKAAAEGGCDTCVLPETWNTGFFPKENLEKLSDNDGKRVKSELASLAKEYNINIVAGSVANKKDGKICNTAYVFNRNGEVVAEYDKTHLFTPMGEHNYFEKGKSPVSFELDGKKCGIVICYDIRFPELCRTLTTETEEHLDLLFVVSQWPKIRTMHLETLTRARAIENQMFLALCNSCGVAGETVYGGASVIYDPWGEILAKAGVEEEIISAECDFSVVNGIRESINVFADRRQEIYNIK